MHNHKHWRALRYSSARQVFRHDRNRQGCHSRTLHIHTFHSEPMWKLTNPLQHPSAAIRLIHREYLLPFLSREAFLNFYRNNRLPPLSQGRRREIVYRPRLQENSVLLLVFQFSTECFCLQFRSTLSDILHLRQFRVHSDL